MFTREQLPRRSRNVTPRRRSYIKKATSRHIRRAAKRNPETPLGVDARSTLKGWAD